MCGGDRGIMVQFSSVRLEPEVWEEDLNVGKSDSLECIFPFLKLNLAFLYNVK